jgi:hypothetical protein
MTDVKAALDGKQPMLTSSSNVTTGTITANSPNQLLSTATGIRRSRMM